MLLAGLRLLPRGLLMISVWLRIDGRKKLAQGRGIRGLCFGVRQRRRKKIVAPKMLTVAELAEAKAAADGDSV